MVEIKYKRKAYVLGTGIGVTIPSELVKKLNITNETYFEIDAMEEPEVVILFKKLKEPKEPKEE